MPQHRYQLSEDQIPQQWYNIAADLPTPMPPPLAPDGSPLQPEMMTPIFPMELILQEVSQERWITIPDPVREVYALWRPTPLYRAVNFERALGTDCKIFYKYEGISPAGSHKPNTVGPPGLLQRAGRHPPPGDRDRRRPVGLVAGARAVSCSGSSARSTWCRVSYDSKPYRRVMIETWGGECVASPSTETNAGRSILAAHPDSTGQPGDRDLRGRRGCRDPGGHQLRPRQRPQPCPAAPDRGRTGGDRPDEAGRGPARRRRRLHRRRLELRRPRLPVPGREVRRCATSRSSRQSRHRAQA